MPYVSVEFDLKDIDSDDLIYELDLRGDYRALSEVSDEDLIEELNSRDSNYRISEDIQGLVEKIYYARANGKYSYYQELLDQLIYEVIGRIG
jgi:hypothetical protein